MLGRPVFWTLLTRYPKASRSWRRPDTPLRTVSCLLVQAILEDDAFVFPAHFPDPHYGRLERDGDEIALMPGSCD